MSDPLLQLPPVIPVAVIEDAADAAPLAKALIAGGLPVVEVTFRTAAAADAIRAIRAQAPDALVLAGTVLSTDQAVEAIEAGAQGAVSPGTNPEVVRVFQERSIPFMPGVATPTEIERAIGLGCRRLKFFPAGVLGGPAALKAIGAPFAHLGIEYCPTGGVVESELAAYHAVPGVVAVGGSWIATREDISARRWDEITQKAASAVSAATGR